MFEFMNEPTRNIVRATLVAMATMLWLAGCMEARMLTTTDEPYGTITTAYSNIPGKIYPAWVATIDGKNQQSGDVLSGGALSSRHTFRLPPGQHTIRIVADLRQATGVIPATYTPRSQQPGTLEIYVERGREYYLGARLTGSRSDEWEAVVWEVKDLENYNHTIVE